MTTTETTTLPREIAAWVADLREWSRAHRWGGCPCADHDAEHDRLMERKRALLERCEAEGAS